MSIAIHSATELGGRTHYAVCATYDADCQCEEPQHAVHVFATEPSPQYTIAKDGTVTLDTDADGRFVPSMDKADWQRACATEALRLEQALQVEPVAQGHLAGLVVDERLTSTNAVRS